MNTGPYPPILAGRREEGWGDCASSTVAKLTLRGCEFNGCETDTAGLGSGLGWGLSYATLPTTAKYYYYYYYYYSYLYVKKSTCKKVNKKNYEKNYKKKEQKNFRVGVYDFIPKNCFLKKKA